MFGFGKEISKEQKLFNYLKAREGQWVNGFKMVQYVKTLHHTQLISNLRRKGIREGFTIENKKEYKNGDVHTFYKLDFTESQILIG